jgi:AraC-like DNA-binding protein
VSFATAHQGHSGYEDAGFFRRLFRRHVRLTPSQYRKRFGELRDAMMG